jgi:hypothetical protein
MRRLLLARRGLRAVAGGKTWTLVCVGVIVAIVVCGIVAAAIRSQTAFVALFLTLGCCAFLVWTIAPAVRNLDSMILGLVRLEIGGPGLILDFQRPGGRVLLSGDVKVENETGCEIRLRSYRFEQISIDLPGAAPITLATPESTCDDIVPHTESRYIKLEKNEVFGGRESLGDAACVPMTLTVSVHFEIEDESFAKPASRTLQCYAFIRAAPHDPLLLP